MRKLLALSCSILLFITGCTGEPNFKKLTDTQNTDWSALKKCIEKVNAKYKVEGTTIYIEESDFDDVISYCS